MKLHKQMMSLLVILLFSSLTQLSFAADPYQYALQWPAPWVFNAPKGMAMDGAGNVYVADMSNNRIQKYARGGAFITQWGTTGTGNGQFNNPQGVAVDGGGNVYVADSGNNRIEKFDSNGNYLIQWGSLGTGNGQFRNPAAVAADAAGNVYVAEANSSSFPVNNRIQKFASDGTFLLTWGSRGTGNNNFKSPNGVAVDAAGSFVYVADTGNNRVIKFDNNGGYITQWNSAGSPAGQLTFPYGIALDGLGNVYVTDNNAFTSPNVFRIQKFKTDGTFDAVWGSTGSGDGQFNNPQGLTADSAGNVFVADTNNNRIQKFAVSGTTTTFDAVFVPPAWSQNNVTNIGAPSGVATDGTGNVYVADTGNNRIQKFDGNGTLITTWGSEGFGDGQFNNPAGVAVDGAGNVYVADTFNYRVQKFDSNGGYITQWDSSDSSAGLLNAPFGVAADGSGNVYVADTGNNQIQKFTVTGTTATFVKAWNSNGSSAGTFNNPFGVTVDATGNNVYVADTVNNQIQKFSASGTFVSAWGTNGAGNGQFSAPRGVTVDTAGNVYVADNGNNRIQKFNGSGSFLATWGTNGAGNGQFSNPSGVAADGSGNIFVADTNNSRIQKFSPSLQVQVNVTLQGAGSVASSPDGISCPSGSCSAFFNTSPPPVTLTATPDPGSSFSAWGGDCGSCGSNLTCTFNVSATRTCTATFNQILVHNLFVTIDVTPGGSGSVNSLPPALPAYTCASGTTCPTTSYLEGTVITLRATPGADSLFTGWSGSGSGPSCTGTDPCVLTMLGDRSVTATFSFVKPARVVDSVGGIVGNYDTLSAAYVAAPLSGATIKARDYTFPQVGLMLDQSKSVVIRGGYDLIFSSPPAGYTDITGPFTIGKGAVTVERLIVK